MKRKYTQENSAENVKQIHKTMQLSQILVYIITYENNASTDERVKMSFNQNGSLNSSLQLME